MSCVTRRAGICVAALVEQAALLFRYSTWLFLFVFIAMFVTIKVHNIWLLMLPGLFFLIGCYRHFWGGSLIQLRSSFRRLWLNREQEWIGLTPHTWELFGWILCWVQFGKEIGPRIGLKLSSAWPALNDFKPALLSQLWEVTEKLFFSLFLFTESSLYYFYSRFFSTTCWIIKLKWCNLTF